VDISLERTFVIIINAPPEATMLAPADGAIYLAQAQVVLTGRGTDPDGTVVRLDLFADGQPLGGANGDIHSLTLSNLSVGTYEFDALATDDQGAMGRSKPVRIHVVSELPMVAGPIVLNPQTGLFEQTVTVSNISATALSSVRVRVHDLDPLVTVYNQSGVVNGVPFVQSNGAVPAGGSVSMIIEYYTRERAVPSPRLVAEASVAPVVPVDPAGSEVRVTRQRRLLDGSFLVEFNSFTGRTYYVQYSGDMKTWTTVMPSVIGTGTSLQWIDNGPPKTFPHPRDVTTRFYRVLLAPQ
jgi:hypothetical protein